jgi:hypothetical protein
VTIGFGGARTQVHGMRHNTPRSGLQARKAVSYSQHPIGAIFACRYHGIGKVRFSSLVKDKASGAIGDRLSSPNARFSWRTASSVRGVRTSMPLK